VFFFQAEDGIRDFHVTGVQTCALPILFDITDRGYLPIEDAVAIVRHAELVISSRYHAVILALSVGTPFVSVLKDVLGDKQYYYRSEERRVGKECRNGCKRDEQYKAVLV